LKNQIWLILDRKELLPTKLTGGGPAERRSGPPLILGALGALGAPGDVDVA